MGKRIIPLILAGGIFLGGCALLAYPRVSQWLNGLHQSEVIADYRSRVYKMPMVRMFALAGKLTNLRMYGSTRRPYRNPDAIYD